MKYIIDIPSELVLKDDGYSFSDGNSYCITGNLSKLTPYTEFNRKDIEDEVWKFVEKLEYLTFGEAEDCFDVEYEGTPFVAGMFSYKEAKAKYEAWMKEKDEIHVGDEIILGRELKMVVIQVDGNGTTIQAVDEDGECYECIELNEVKKTGRHFDEVAELLKKMNEDT